LRGWSIFNTEAFNFFFKSNYILLFADVAMTRQHRRNAVGKDRKCSEAEISSRLQSRQGEPFAQGQQARARGEEESKSK
jgi:hypothetical protein